MNMTIEKRQITVDGDHELITNVWQIVLHVFGYPEGDMEVSVIDAATARFHLTADNAATHADAMETAYKMARMKVKADYRKYLADRKRERAELTRRAKDVLQQKA